MLRRVVNALTLSTWFCALLSAVAMVEAIHKREPWEYLLFVGVVGAASVAVTLNWPLREVLLPVASLFGAIAGAGVSIEVSAFGSGDSSLGSLMFISGSAAVGVVMARVAVHQEVRRREQERAAWLAELAESQRRLEEHVRSLGDLSGRRGPWWRRY